MVNLLRGIAPLLYKIYNRANVVARRRKAEASVWCLDLVCDDSVALHLRKKAEHTNKTLPTYLMVICLLF